MSRIKALLSTLPLLCIDCSPPDMFPHFGRLPIELRTKIWGIAASEPRVIKLLEVSDSNSCYSMPEKLSLIVPGQSKVPAILHVSKEARAEGLRYYEPSVQRSNSATEPGDTVYANFEVDIFWRAGAGFQARRNYVFGAEVRQYGGNAQ